MIEEDSYKKFIVLLSCTALLISAIGVSPIKDITTENSAPLSKNSVEDVIIYDNSKTPHKHGTRAGSPRTVLAELFTNWGCGICPRGGSSMCELMDVYDSSQLVMIEYHIDTPRGDDPFNNYNPSENKARKDYYSVSGIPTMFADSTKSGMGGDATGTYNEYKETIDAELSELSNMTITLEGNLDLISLNGTINATIEVTDTLPFGTLNVRFAVVEDNRYTANAPNGEVRHRYVMRDILTDELLPALTVGQSYDVTRTFPIDPIFNLDSISVVVFVQNDDDKDVLQAALYDYIPQDILVIDDDDSGHPHGYEDDYCELLTEMDYAFDGWTLNERGSPTSDDLADYEAVIWITANTFSSTLTTADQTAISDYLDNGSGSLFLTGDNVGSDIGSTTFYQDYLHANFLTGDTGESQITGMDNDPISDPFFGSIIPISSSSPSEISPIGPATTVFRYSPSGDIGGIKAIHDYDSKVVYFAFMYFEGPDSATNKTTLMERILNWMMNLSYSIPLSEGWNLISIPFIQPDTSLDTVLSSINGYYDTIYWYNVSDNTDHWKVNNTSKSLQMNDLSDLTHEVSFWIHITTPGGALLKCNGTQPTGNQTIDLHIGWNLVGYPSLMSRERDAALNNIEFGLEVDSVWTYNAASQLWEKLGTSDNFKLGGGYWIHSKVEKVWDVPL